MTSPTARLDILRNVTSTSRNERRADDDTVRLCGSLERLCTGRDETEGHNREGPFVSAILPSNAVGDSRARLEKTSVEVAPFSLTLLPLLMIQPALLLPLAHRWRGRQRMARSSAALSGVCLTQQRAPELHHMSRLSGVHFDKKACLWWDAYAIRIHVMEQLCSVFVRICSLPDASPPPSTHLLLCSNCSFESILIWVWKSSVIGAYCVCHPL